MSYFLSFEPSFITALWTYTTSNCLDFGSSTQTLYDYRMDHWRKIFTILPQCVQWNTENIAELVWITVIMSHLGLKNTFTWDYKLLCSADEVQWYHNGNSHLHLDTRMMFKINPLKNLPQTTSYPIQISNDLKYVQEFSSVFFVYFFIKGEPKLLFIPS